MKQILTEPLENAIKQLEEAISFASAEKAKGNLQYFYQFRTASIQSFEYCFGLSITLIKKIIESSEFKTEVDLLSYHEVVRTAFEKGLIESVENWFNYREMRNETSHAYEKSKAEEVFEKLPKFAISAKFLLEKINSKK